MPLCGGSSFAAMNTHLTPNPLLAKHESHLCADWGQRQPAHGRARCWALSVPMWTLPRVAPLITAFAIIEEFRAGGAGTSHNRLSGPRRPWRKHACGVLRQLDSRTTL